MVISVASGPPSRLSMPPTNVDVPPMPPPAMEPLRKESMSSSLCSGEKMSMVGSAMLVATCSTMVCANSVGPSASIPLAVPMPTRLIRLLVSPLATSLPSTFLRNMKLGSISKVALIAPPARPRPPWTSPVASYTDPVTSPVVIGSAPAYAPAMAPLLTRLRPAT